MFHIDGFTQGYCKKNLFGLWLIYQDCCFLVWPFCHIWLCLEFLYLFFAVEKFIYDRWESGSIALKALLHFPCTFGNIISCKKLLSNVLKLLRSKLIIIPILIVILILVDMVHLKNNYKISFILNYKRSTHLYHII